MNQAVGDAARVGRPSDTRHHLDRPLVWLMSFATGLSVASNYYAQPLLPDLERDLHLTGSTAGWIIVVAQLGYALGLIFVLPLGDLFERRR